MDTNPLFTIALGLMSPWEVQRTEFDADRRVLRLRVNFTVGSRFECPECSASSCPVHDTVEKEWRHLDFFQHQAFISARVPRISCAKCGVRLVTVPWARPGSNFTMLMEALLLELVRQMPVHGVAKLTGISDSALWRVIYHHVDAAVRRIDCSRLVQVGVDETSARKGHDYISCFFDMVSRRLVFATEGREHEVVAAFARFLGAHNGDSSTVRDVSCDMSPAFIKGVREHLPNACVTFDKFHVVKILSDAMERVRRSEWRHDKTVKGGRWALLKNPEHLTPKQRDQLHELIARNATLAEAYRIKETFRDFYRQPDLKAATGFLKGWITMAHQSAIKPIIKAAKTIRNRSKGILRWFVSHLTNAVMEGLNSLLQAAKRKARGYRLHKTFITMAYLIAGKLTFDLQPCTSHTH